MRKPVVAVMQPYFMPYAGYFRLVAAADVFVFYDCVQFSKGSWVHRNRLPDASGDLRWLTLPLQRCHLGTRINQLRFLANADAEFKKRANCFPILRDCRNESLVAELEQFEYSPAEYLARSVMRVSKRLGLHTHFIFASSLKVPDHLPRTERLLEVIRRVGGNSCTYVNSPGGRDMYDPVEFAQRGVSLRFLTDYIGSKTSVLYRLLSESPLNLSREIRANTCFQESGFTYTPQVQPEPMYAAL